MSPDLGSALVKAHIALGRDPIEAYRQTEEILLKLHQEEMKRINEHYDKILEGKKTSKFEPSSIYISIIVIISIIVLFNI